MPATTMLIGGIVFSVGGLLGSLGFSALSDRVGRRPVFIVAAAFTALYAFPLFWLVDIRSAPIIWLAQGLGGVANGTLYGLMGALTAEMFDARVRYTGASIGQQVSAAAVGGTTPLIVTGLVAQADSYWPAPAWLAALAVISLVCVYLARETGKNRTLDAGGVVCLGRRGPGGRSGVSTAPLPDAVATAAAVTAGTISPVELVEAVLERVERIDPVLNSYTTLLRGRALARAHAIGRTTGTTPRPLPGLPVAVKDNLHVAGAPTSLGVYPPAVAEPVRSAEAVRLLERGPEPSCWARPTCTSSPTAPPVTCRRSGRCATRTIRPGWRAARAADRRPRSRPGCAPRPWVPTPVGRSGCPRHCAASSGSSRPGARSAPGEWCRSGPLSTASGC